MATVAPYEFGEHVELATFVDDQPCFALAGGTIRFPVSGDRVCEVHDGLLCAALSVDAAFIVTGGEDGRVVRTGLEGQSETLARHAGKWIDVLSCGPGNTVGFASGRTVWALADGEESEWPHERAVEGLAFAPKGRRIACARYGGVSLHWLAGSGTPVDLPWDGAHTGVTFSPDGRYVVTTMAENALHGWRLDGSGSRRNKEAGRHMRMSGYPAKPKSLSWSARGRWLASSGAQAAICWPFTGKDGPMGQAPRELGTRGDSMVVQVACHPLEEVVAIGYADGMVMAVRLADGDEALLRRPGKSAISSLAWDRGGDRLAFGSEEGEAGLIAITE